MKRVVLLFCMVFLVYLGMNPVAADARNPIRIGYLQSDIHQLACWVALEKGFYKNEGLDVAVVGVFKAGPEEMSAFAAGDLDIGYVGEAPATTAVANGVAKVTVLAQVNTEGSAIVVRKNSRIRHVQDFVDRRVAIPGYSTVQDFLFRKALEKFGVKPERVKIIVLKPPEMIGALRTKQIDAFIAWEPYPAKSQTMGIGRILITSAEIWKDHPCCVLVANNSFLANYPDEVKAFVRAHVTATDFINMHPGEAAGIAAKYTGIDEKTVELAMKNVNYTYALSIEGEKKYVGFLSRLKYINIPDPQAFVDGFIDQKILGENIKK